MAAATVATAATASPLPKNHLFPPRILMRGSPCLFGRSMFDSLIITNGTSSSRKHYDRTFVNLRQEKEHNNNRFLHVDLEAAAAKSTPRSSSSPPLLPLGRARPYPPFGSTACPTTIKKVTTTSSTTTTTTTTSKKKKKPYPQLAVVGLILDPTGTHVLLTRRRHYMRSFPGAWVLPGGGVEYENGETLEDALKREVEEETGLALLQQQQGGGSTSAGSTSSSSSSVQPICLWESVYPTDPSEPGPIKAHHLVVFMKAYVDYDIKNTATGNNNNSNNNLEQEEHPHHHHDQMMMPPLKLQESEVDSALWLSLDNFQRCLEEMKKKEKEEDHHSSSPSSSSLSSSSSLPLVTIHKNDGTTELSSLQTILGIYPQPDNNTAQSQQKQQQQQQQQYCGIAQGSLFALEELLLTTTSTTSTTNNKNKTKNRSNHPTDEGATSSKRWNTWDHDLSACLPTTATRSSL